jgi:hypothetical protein
MYDDEGNIVPRKCNLPISMTIKPTNQKEIKGIKLVKETKKNLKGPKS